MKAAIIPGNVQTPLDAPLQNLCGLNLIFKLENGLREFVVEELSKLFGPRWYKQRLPGDILKKYADSISIQRQIRWSKIIPHHPIYYVDFPDLKKIIERQDNWDDCFSKFFGRKDLISATLSELEPVRNSLAHNRLITADDLALLEGASTKIIHAIGVDRFSELVSKTSTSSTIPEELRKLKAEIRDCSSACKKCLGFKVMDEWVSVSGQWWFDETYLGRPTEAIERCFSLFSQYVSLPRQRGQGHIIECWVRTSGVIHSSESALEAVQQLIESSR